MIALRIKGLLKRFSKTICLGVVTVLSVSSFAQHEPNYFKDKETQLKLRSAMYWPEKISKTTPLLIMHGSGDWRTPLSSTLTLVQKLTELKHPLRFVLYEGAVHGLRGVGISRENMWWEWLDRYVKNKSALPDMELHGE